MVSKHLIKIILFNTAIILSQSKEMIKNKFEPKNGKVLFFIGQDLEAVGGFEKYNDGYVDYFETPEGITLYTNLSPGDESFGYITKGIDGIKTKANWGAGDTCAQYYIDSPKFKNAMIAIGLSLVNHEKEIAKGKLDKLIIEFGEWIKKVDRPIFLRIGYEFDGWEWNHYNKKYYLKAYRRIHNIFDKMKISNVAYVWQSKGNGSNQKTLEEWYPGDDYVDWCGYSYFNNPDEEMIYFARKHKKPVFIAEACPVMGEGNVYFDTDLKKENIAKQVWKDWFTPFFETIEKNKDVIKAFSYINIEWASQPMWLNNSYFQKVDSRIQKSTFISKKWKQELDKSMYIKSK